MPDCRNLPYALIVEDHPLVADSLVACVRDCDAQLALETADSLRAALHILARRPDPRLIIADLTLTDSRGAESIKRMRQVAREAPILVFTALDEPLLRAQAAEFGVVAYLIKSTSSQTLRSKIRSVLGRHPTPHRVAPVIAGRASRLLTAKQVEVVEELMAGRSNKQIAIRLNLSDETVGSHMKEILSRLGARNRTEAVVRYLEEINQPHDRQKG